MTKHKQRNKQSFSEEQFVAWLKKQTPVCVQRTGRKARGVIPGLTGIGDDAAVIPVNNSFLVVTTDAIVENVHFSKQWSAPQDIGWKAMAVNVSDMAAMGVQPQWALVTAGFPKSENVSYLKAVHKGLSACAAHYGCRILGGDTVRSDKWFINVAMGGTTKEKENPILRSGARDGDYIFVTGTLGNAACGLTLFKKNIKDARYRYLFQSHKKPRAKLKEALALVKTSCVSAMMDISDGLSKDLARLVKESNTGAIIFKQQLPLHNTLLKASQKIKADSYDFALHGGEDYELLFTVKKEKISAFYEHYAKHLTDGIMPSLIGEITRGKKNRLHIVDNDGIFILKPGGYDHFMHHTC